MKKRKENEITEMKRNEKKKNLRENSNFAKMMKKQIYFERIIKLL